MRTRGGPGWLVACAAAVSGCAAEVPARNEEASPVYQGVPERGQPWVVAVYYTRPGTTRLRLCTGSLVGSRAVLTAKHCVHDEPTEGQWVALQPSAFTVAVGFDVTDPASLTEERGVTAIRTTPGVYASPQALAGDDLAVLLLDGDVAVAPRLLARSAPAVGEALFIAGFGFTEGDVLGRKHSGATTVSTVTAGTFESASGAWTCTGDSGGPAARALDGAVLGVTSTGPRGCATPRSIYTRVDRHLALIDAALAESGGCVPREETCNGVDDDCDAVVDPGCAAAGGNGGGGAGGGTPAGAGGGAGAATGGAAGVTGGASASADSDGGCRTTPTPRGAGTAAMLTLGVLGLLLGRRRTARAGSQPTRNTTNFR